MPRENALHSGRIGGALKLAMEEANMIVMKKERRWASDAPMVYVRSNIEDPIWVSKAFVKGGTTRQPGQGIKMKRASDGKSSRLLVGASHVARGGGGGYCVEAAGVAD